MAFFRWKRRSPKSNGDDSLSLAYPLIYDANLRLQSEKYNEARPFLLRALEFRDEITDAATVEYLLDSLCATWLLTEKYDEGIAAFSEYLDRHPKDPAAHRERGALRWYLGQTEKAIHDYSEALKLNPNDILSLSGRGQIFAEADDNQKAIEDLNLALQLLKTAPRTDPARRKWYDDIEAFVHSGRGVALAGLGDQASGMNEFEMSIVMCPENAWVYFNRACVFDRDQDSAKAASDYRAALDKKGPALTPLQRRHAEKRLRELRVQ
jgi:Tfp pilus assembly protein PilF